MSYVKYQLFLNFLELCLLILWGARGPGRCGGFSNIYHCEPWEESPKFVLISAFVFVLISGHPEDQDSRFLRNFSTEHAYPNTRWLCI
jgi:hypothetical protein